MDSTHESKETTAPPGESIPSEISDPRQRFDRFVHRMEKLIYGRMLRLIGDAETAGELTQETFLKSWKAWGSLDPAGREQAWVRKIADNVAVSHLRAAGAQKRGKALPLNLAPSSPEGHEDGWNPHDPVDSHQAQPLRQLIDAEERSIAFAVRERLDEREREILDLWCDGASYLEIAARTGRSEAAIGPALTRIRARLRRMAETTSPDSV